MSQGSRENEATGRKGPWEPCVCPARRYTAGAGSSESELLGQSRGPAVSWLRTGEAVKILFTSPLQWL